MIVISSKTSSIKNPAYQTKADTGSARVTISVDPHLLNVIDSYAHGAEVSRSAVFEEAIMLWYEKFQEEADRKFYAREAEDPEIESWNKLTSESAKYLWQKPVE